MKKIMIPPVFLFICLVLIALCYFQFPELNKIIFPFNLIGVIIAFVGFALMGKARDMFKKHSTSLLITKSSSLVEEGVYCRIRNPMYCGMFILLLGLAICSQNIFSLFVPFVFLSVINFYVVPVEESLMEEAFGQQYLDYKKKTGRWF